VLDKVHHGRQSATSSPLEVKPLPVFDIAEVSRRTGVPASTLRYYDEKGLIRPIGRRGLRRLFDAGVLDRLALIALGRSAGFSLQEIGGMFGPDGRPRINRAALAARADSLDATIRKLTALREGLRHASVCPARNHLECPTFRRLMRLAAGRKKKLSAPF
jgi:DNA-binding transcriptional MerR regulator